MSNFGTVPAAVAAALSAVDGMRGFELRPRSTKPGDAWVRWVNAVHDAPGSLVDAWQVIVLLADNEEAQRTWIAAHRWLIIDALQDANGPDLFVEGMEAGTVNDSPALLINCRE